MSLVKLLVYLSPAAQITPNNSAIMSKVKSMITIVADDHKFGLQKKCSNLKNAMHTN